MGGWFKKVSAPAAPQEDLGAALMRLTRAYWTRAPEELARLRPEAGSLPFPKLLRLHHLVCLELLYVNGALTGGDAMDLAEGPDTALWVKTAARLSGEGSPYLPRPAVVLQRPRGAAPANTLEGELRNASASHFGALEVVRLKDQFPVALDFVGFGELAFVGVGPPSLFPPAKLRYRDGREELVCLPLLYGASWFSTEPSDQNGSMTRFVCHHAAISGGVGLGHQDFTSAGALFGLGSVQQLTF